MGDIYSNALYVILWLGETRHNSEALCRLLDIGRYSRKYDTLLSRWSSEGESLQQAGYRILYDTYWNRVWVVQEVVCAARCVVIAGAFQANLDDVARLVPEALSKFHWGDHNFKPETWTRESLMPRLFELRGYLASGKRLSFPDLLEKLDSCISTREVDRIYGLLGLAMRLDPMRLDSSGMDIDYDKTYGHVVLEVAFSYSTKSELRTQPSHRDWKSIARLLLRASQNGRMLSSMLQAFATAQTTSSKQKSWAKTVGYFHELLPFSQGFTDHSEEINLVGRLDSSVLLDGGLWLAINHSLQEHNQNDRQKQDTACVYLAMHVYLSGSPHKASLGLLLEERDDPLPDSAELEDINSVEARIIWGTKKGSSKWSYSCHFLELEAFTTIIWLEMLRPFDRAPIRQRWLCTHESCNLALPPEAEFE